MLAKKLNAVLIKEITLGNIVNAISEAIKKSLPVYENGTVKLIELLELSLKISL